MPSTYGVSVAKLEIATNLTDFVALLGIATQNPGG